MKRKNLIIFLLTLFVCIMSGSVYILSMTTDTRTAKWSGKPESPKIRMSYVQSSFEDLPDPYLFTHLIYAFATFNDGNDGIIIENPEKLRAMSNLKEQNPELKIILGIGGSKREGFSEMCRSSKKRKAFVKNCSNIISEYNLDGIDLDWEFPGTEAGGHTANKKDSRNYGTLVKDLRKALGDDQWISFYSNNSGKWIDFGKMLPYVSCVNVSGYNLDTPKPDQILKHQSPLYPSKEWGSWCVQASVMRHIKLGVPPEKILLGIPFFGRGKAPFRGYLECRDLDKYAEGKQLLWNNDAKAPYYTDSIGNLALGFDNEKSIEQKCEFIRELGLAGAFVWHYNADYTDHRLSSKLMEGLSPIQAPVFHKNR